MHDLLKRLFRYKAWANATLLATLVDLGEDHPVTPLAIKALSHTHVVDRIFAAHLRRERHAYRSVNLAEPPALKTLVGYITASDREYIDYVATLDPRQLSERIGFSFTDGAVGCMSRQEMLMHLLTHGAGHRGQVSALMLLNGLTPAPDGFTTWLHEAEAVERRSA